MERARIKWEERAEGEERPRASRYSPNIDAGAATTHLPVRIAGHGDYDAIQLWKAGLPASFSLGGGSTSYWTDRLSILRRTNGSNSWGSGRVPNRRSARAGRLVVVSGSVGGCSGAFVFDFVT